MGIHEGLHVHNTLTNRIVQQKLNKYSCAFKSSQINLIHQINEQHFNFMKKKFTRTWAFNIQSSDIACFQAIFF